jgi:cytochrome c peroxidase
LLPIKAAFPELSNADIWQFAGAVSIKNAGGELKWRPGRADAISEHVAGTGASSVALLNDADRMLRVKFYRIGFNDQEIVALMGGELP